MITRVLRRTLCIVRTACVGRSPPARTKGANLPIMSDLSAHRRPLATAAAAAGMLFALGFVPSAQASPESAPDTGDTLRTASAAAAPAETVRTTADPGVTAGPRLREEADSDPTPYVLGALGVAGAGGLLAARIRHTRG
jgi:hypothetical protein